MCGMHHRSVKCTIAILLMLRATYTVLSEEDIKSKALTWSAIQWKLRAVAPVSDTPALDPRKAEADKIESELAAVGLDVRALVGNVCILD